MGGWASVNYWPTDEKGILQLVYKAEGTEGDMPDGRYTVHIEKQDYTTVEFSVELSTDAAQRYNHITPHVFILPKQGIIAAVVVDAAGKSVSSAAYQIVGTDGRTVWSGYGIETGRIESAPISDGYYTLKIHAYIGGEYTAIARSVTMSGGTDMFLGNIVLGSK